MEEKQCCPKGAWGYQKEVYNIKGKEE